MNPALARALCAQVAEFAMTKLVRSVRCHRRGAQHTVLISVGMKHGVVYVRHWRNDVRRMDSLHS